MPATDNFVRPLNKLHLVFAVSSLAMLVATIWMLAADHADEWRAYQAGFDRAEAEKIRRDVLNAKTKLGGGADAYDSRLKSLEQELSDKSRQVDSQSQDLPQLRVEIKRLRNEADLAGREVRVQRALRDVARADYDLGVRDQRDQEQLGRLLARFEDQQKVVDHLELDLQRKEAARDEAVAKLASATQDRDTTADALKEMRTEVELLHTALTKIEPDTRFSRVKRQVMGWPIIDGFNSPRHIIQDWLPDLRVKLGMTETARFDRCRTCHLGIDRTETGDLPSFPHGTREEGKYPHPYSTHPRPDVYLTAASPHPLPKFGCTTCHEGQGSGTSFSNAAHLPNDPHEAHVWEKEHKFFFNHFWEFPMYPERLRESTCVKCHHNVVELGVNAKFGPTAPKVYEGWQLVQEYGCFGCHEIQGYDAGTPIGPDLRLEPQTPAETAKIAADPNQVPGQMRKVGPSLRHIASKTTAEWIAYWTELPKDFRPTTRMPQFFHLTNQQDKVAERFQPIELAAISQYLIDKSEPLELMSPANGYQANAERGRELFSQRGCLACHSHQHEQFKDLRQFKDLHQDRDFAPDLTQVHAKIKPGEDGFRWLYTWIRDPQRHHPRSRMPNLFLEPEGQGEKLVDPAADIAAFLLQSVRQEDPTIAVRRFIKQNPLLHPDRKENPTIAVEDRKFVANARLDENTSLDQLVVLYLSKSLQHEAVVKVMTDPEHRYPVARDKVKGDEIELVADGAVSSDEWKRMKLNYVGRRSISRYGCYGCHDMANFEEARPIGTTLQDWGRKDTSRLALEHIEEFLHHHGEPDANGEPNGASTHERIQSAMERADDGEDDPALQQELSAAFFYESLMHHGRPGFIWQKLRSPRSYDYMKTETKGYDERLRMPQFPLDEVQIEKIATFILGLVAEPPMEKYLYRPHGPAGDVIEGERLLQKYNCVGCHILEMPEIRYGVDLDEFAAKEPDAAEHPQARELLLQLKPPQKGLTGQTQAFDADGKKVELPVVRFHGLIYNRPDPEDDPADQEFAYDLWETLDVDGKPLMPGSRMLVPATKLVDVADAANGYARSSRGGPFAEWLVEELLRSGRAESNRSLAWQMSPPPLYKEGIKVQTPWLFQFLKEPNRIRHTTVLRMPRFNMSDEEALALANYFAAVDHTPYPYQEIVQRDPDYVDRMNSQYESKHADRPDDYLAESWRLLNAPVCIKCHSLGGREFKTADPKKDIRGPNLDVVTNRLQPDWTLLWLFKPSWITPYTSMPAPFAKNQQQFHPLFDGEPLDQTIGIRDALMNYHRLMEREGKYEPEPTATVGQTEETP